MRRGALERCTISRIIPRSRLCGSGARRTGSNPARPEVTLALFADGLDERGGRWNPSNSFLSRALIRLRKAGLRNMMRMAELKVRIHPPPAALREIGLFQSRRSVIGQASISARKPIAGESNHALSGKAAVLARHGQRRSPRPEHRYLAISKSAHRAAGLRRIVCGTRCAVARCPRTVL